MKAPKAETKAPKAETPSPTQQMLDAAIAVLKKEWLFPDSVAKLEKKLRAHHANKRYDTIRSPDKLAKQLTEDIAEVVKQGAPRVVYSEQPLPDDHNDRITADELAQMRLHGRQYNSFIDRVERLPGNIGYMRFRALVAAPITAGPLGAAMSFIADTEELVIDLRDCQGDYEPDVVALVVTYFVDERRHISDVHWRASDRTDQHWTSTDVRGRRYDKPVYVLVGEDTGAGGEELAHALQTLKRAKIVGEATGGRALHVRRRRIAPNFGLIVPIGRSISALAKKGWEGSGVKPDVRSDDALGAAHLAALRAVRKRTDPKKMPKDFVPRYVDELDQLLEKAAKKKPKKR